MRKGNSAAVLSKNGFCRHNSGWIFNHDISGETQWQVAVDHAKEQGDQSAQ